jgi:hypothetical protein
MLGVWINLDDNLRDRRTRRLAAAIRRHDDETGGFQLPSRRIRQGTLIAAVFVVIRGGGGLGPLAGKLSAYGLGNPQNARIERLTGARSVIVRGVKSLSFVFLRHSGAPSLGSTR